MADVRQRRRNWLVIAVLLLLASYRQDVIKAARTLVRDNARPSAELAGKIALVFTVATLSVVLLLALLYVALQRIRRGLEHIGTQLRPLVLTTWIALRVSLAPPPPSSSALLPRPAF